MLINKYLLRYVHTITFLLMSCFAFAQLGQLENFWWQPNGNVNAIVTSGNTVYIGGSFSYVGPEEPYGAKLDTITGQPDFSFPNPNGNVLSSVSDGNGGWYIGGDFTEVGGKLRGKIAHINSAKQVTNFAENVFLNGSVRALQLHNNILYAGGAFTQIGTLEAYAASLSPTTGAPDFSILNPNGEVSAAVADGFGGWIIGGNFTKVGGQTRNYIARINANGSLSAWRPNVNNPVTTSLLS
jgi:hypothetical protein